MLSAKLVTFVVTLLAQEVVALNAHRHAHNQLHAKKDVVYVNDVVTVTDWTIVTVYEDGTTSSTTAPKAIYKGAHTEQYSSASTSSSANSTTISTTSSSSSSSSSSTSTSLSSSSTSVYTPTTLSTYTKSSSSSVATTSSIDVAHVNAAQADITTPTYTSISTPAYTPIADTTTAVATTSTSAAAAATTASSSSSSSSGNKRGLAYNDGSLLSPFLNSGSKCSWSYNWGATADSNAPSDVEFVPMLWGPTFADAWPAAAEAAIASGVTNFLSFNECDNAGQCNLDAASAAAAHIKYMNPYKDSVKIGTPAITNSNSEGEGVDWLTNFLSACGGECAYDFCTAHWYNTADTTDFFNHLDAVYAACGKPVWITEFAPTGSDDEINTFLETVMNEMDTNSAYSYVERYSYFMAATGSLLSSSSELSTYGQTYGYS